ncbi:MAG: hypothetical protein ACRDFB_09790, partial [Rhabdochlamydiaceae bacterium]
MSSKPISFFTPVKYPSPASWYQKAIGGVDAYWHLRGPVAVVVLDQGRKGGEGVKLEGQAIWWQSGLKVM